MNNSIKPTSNFLSRIFIEVKNNKFSMVSLLFILTMMLVALLAPWLAPHDPNALNLLEARMLPPAFLEGGQWKFVLGTDNTGRDMLSRLIYGARISIFIGLVPVFIGFSLGVPFGLVAGYWGGKADLILMRINEVVLAFPSTLLALIVVAILGPGILNCMLAVGVVSAPGFAVVVRSAVLSERHKEYILGAISQGASSPAVLWRHVLPNISSTLIVITTLNFAFALLDTAALSFLGLGVRPPTAEWGAMLADAKNYFNEGWWMILFPGVLIFLVVISLNILGDHLRDAFDPRNSLTRKS